MKTVFKNIIVFAVILSSFTSYANTSLKFTHTLNASLKKGNLVSVYNKAGLLIYSDRIVRSGNYKIMFDFSKLKNGIYKLEINKDFEILLSSFRVENHSVLFLEHEEKTIHKPVFRKEEDKLLISKLALDSSDMTVELYFEDSLIFSEALKETNSIINRIYKLDGKVRGDYKAIIKSNGRTYIKYFSI